MREPGISGIPAGISVFVTRAASISGRYQRTAGAERLLARAEQKCGEGGNRPGANFHHPPSGNLHPVILDHRVGEQFSHAAFSAASRAGFVGPVEFDVEQLALPDAGDPVDAQRLQRALDGLALRVKHAVFRVTVTRAFMAATPAGMAFR